MAGKSRHSGRALAHKRRSIVYDCRVDEDRHRRARKRALAHVRASIRICDASGDWLAACHLQLAEDLLLGRPSSDDASSPRSPPC